MSGRLAGKRAIVTGAGSGIGRAAAVRFAEEGARVGLVDIDEGEAAETAAAISNAAGESLLLVADVTQEDAIAAAVDRAVAAWGGLDVVVANAAVLLADEDDRVDRLDLAVWQRTLDVNLTGAFLTCKHGLRDLLAKTPLRRQGLPEEVAEVMLFLASDEAAYVTGAVWAADGGMTAV